MILKSGYWKNIYINIKQIKNQQINIIYKFNNILLFVYDCIDGQIICNDIITIFFVSNCDADTKIINFWNIY